MDAALNLPYSQVFSPKTSHKCPCSTCSWLKPHPPINELSMVTALDWRSLVQTGKKNSENDGPTKVKGLFSQSFCARKERNWLLSANQALFEADPSIAILFAPSEWPHPPPLFYSPFCSRRTYLQRTVLEVISQDESFMRSTEFHQWESVNMWTLSK